MIATKDKIRIARLLSRAVLGARAIAGQGAVAQVRRGGLVWELDLREGIDLAIYLRLYERATLRAYRRFLREGAVAVDIGANIGAHTLELARLVGKQGRVYAFEPTAYAFMKLLRNLRLNPEVAQQVVAAQCMLTDGKTAIPSEIFSSWPLQTADRLHEVHLGRPMSTDGATSAPLDACLFAASVQRVDLIKIDVDGYECVVLRGAVETLRRFRPIVILELAPYTLQERGSDANELAHILEDLSYETRDLHSGRSLSIRELAASLPAGVGINIVAQPVPE